MLTPRRPRDTALPDGFSFAEDFLRKREDDSLRPARRESLRPEKGAAKAAAATAILVGTAVPASAATLTLDGASSSLSVSIGGLPAITLAGSNTPIFVSSGGGSFVEPASVFAGFVVLPKQLFTGLSLPVSSLPIGSLNVTLANGTKTITAAGGGGGGMGGAGPLQGRALAGIFNGPISLSIPLSPIGNATGYDRSGGAATLLITVTGHLWTTGVASVTEVTPFGFVVGRERLGK